MRLHLKKILQNTLRVLAQLTIKRFKPIIIGVTGSAGKTSTKEAIATVLEHCNRRVRSSPGTTNTEFGFPTVILGEYRKDEMALVGKDGPPGHLIAKSFFWLRVIIGACWNLLFLKKVGYPEVLVLEYGADKAGDLDMLLAIAKPHIAIITVIGDIPVHVENYKDIDEVVVEKQKLITCLLESDFALLNADDPRVAGMRSKTKAKTILFGFSEGSDMHITDLDFIVEGSRRATPKPVGMIFNLGKPGDFVSVSIEGALGAPQAYAAAAAALAVNLLGESLAHIGEALSYYRAPQQRLRIIPGIEGALILDDTYNSSPIAVAAALDVLKSLKAKRKIAVLGDMKELGLYEKRAHEQAGKWVVQASEILITVGEAAKYISDAAVAAGMDKKAVFHFATTAEAIFPLRDLLKTGDLVLIKASHSLHFEQIVEGVRMGRIVE